MTLGAAAPPALALPRARGEWRSTRRFPAPPRAERGRSPWHWHAGSCLVLYQAGEDLEEARNPFREGTGSLSLSSKTRGCFSRGWPAGRSSGYSPDGGSNNHSMTTASIPTPTPCPKSEEEPRRAGAEASRVSPGGVSGPGGWGLIAGTVSVCEAAPCRGRLWFSTRPQQENGSRGAVGASFLGALQRRQPKVRAGSGPWLGE